MNCVELSKLKAGLLCYGINVDEKVGKRLLAARPYFYDKGFVHAINANILGSNVCFSVAERFSHVSPYRLCEIDGKFFVATENDEKVPISLFDDLPRTGTVVDELARPHSNHVISLWPSLVCCYDKPGMKCKFCSIETTPTQTVVPAVEVVAGLKALFEKTGDRYSINLGGGTHKNPDNMAKYLIEIVKGIREFSATPISLELAPPTDLDLLAQLKAAGASSLIMNLEVANPALRKEICPGKSSITYEHYYECYRKGIKEFGRGRVSCVLIAGIQPKEDIVAECEKLTDVGVIPTIIPFKAMDNCQLHDRGNCDRDELLWISMRVSGILARKGLSPQMQEGCTKCGGCSLETNSFDAD